MINLILLCIGIRDLSSITTTYIGELKNAMVIIISLIYIAALFVTVKTVGSGNSCSASRTMMSVLLHSV